MKRGAARKDSGGHRRKRVPAVEASETRFCCSLLTTHRATLVASTCICGMDELDQAGDKASTSSVDRVHVGVVC